MPFSFDFVEWLISYARMIVDWTHGLIFDTNNHKKKYFKQLIRMSKIATFVNDMVFIRIIDYWFFFVYVMFNNTCCSDQQWTMSISLDRKFIDMTIKRNNKTQQTTSTIITSFLKKQISEWFIVYIAMIIFAGNSL